MHEEHREAIVSQCLELTDMRPKAEEWFCARRRSNGSVAAWSPARVGGNTPNRLRDRFTPRL
jgi:hypothetical protein